MAEIPTVPEIIERYRSGESIQEVTKDCRRHRRTIYQWMLSHLGEKDYFDLVTEVLISRVSDADEEMDAARLSKDPVRVSAARETQRFARMDLERRRPELYGQKKEVKHTGAQPGLTIVLLDKPSTGGLLDVTPRLEPAGLVVENQQEAA